MPATNNQRVNFYYEGQDSASQNNLFDISNMLTFTKPTKPIQGTFSEQIDCEVPRGNTNNIFRLPPTSSGTNVNSSNIPGLLKNSHLAANLNLSLQNDLKQPKRITQIFDLENSENVNFLNTGGLNENRRKPRFNHP
jgi:hypothetical protein